MSEISSYSLVEVIGTASLAVIAVFVGIQRLLKDWKSNGAETSVITLMHTELERMSQQNTNLSVELGRLHTQVIALNQQLQQLTVENQRLHTEVIALTNEVSSLKIITRKENYGKIEIN